MFRYTKMCFRPAAAVVVADSVASRRHSILLGLRSVAQCIAKSFAMHIFHLSLRLIDF